MLPITRAFHKYRDPSLPPLHDFTCLILEGIWEDDYESFALLSPGGR